MAYPYVDFHQPPPKKGGGKRTQEDDEDHGVRKATTPPPAVSCATTTPSWDRNNMVMTKSVTFKFKEMLEQQQQPQERPALATALPLTWLPAGGTQYLVISDEEEEEEEEEEDKIVQDPPPLNKKMTPGDPVGPHPGPGAPHHHQQQVQRSSRSDPDKITWQQERATADDGHHHQDDDEREEIFKIERSFKEKLSHLTKDLGNLLSQPSHNLREFLRRREGYAPPEKCKDTSLSVEDDEPLYNER